MRVKPLTTGFQLRDLQRTSGKERDKNTMLWSLLLKGYSDVLPTFLCFLNVANTLVHPEEDIPKHRQRNIILYALWSGVRKPNHPSLNTYCRRANASDRDSAVYTRWQDSFVLTSPGMVGICLILRVWVEAETDPERVGGLVLWSLWRSLRLRRRGEFTGLDQGLRLRPDKVILCLHLWTLPPLDDLREEESERAARYASKLQALFK